MMSSESANAYLDAAKAYLTQRWEFQGLQYGPWPTFQRPDRDQTTQRILKSGKHMANRLIEAKAYLRSIPYPQKVVAYMRSVEDPKNLRSDVFEVHRPEALVSTRLDLGPSDLPDPSDLGMYPQHFIRRLSLYPDAWAATRSVCRYWYRSSATKAELFGLMTDTYRIGDYCFRGLRFGPYPEAPKDPEARLEPQHNVLGCRYGTGVYIQFMDVFRYVLHPHSPIVRFFHRDRDTTVCLWNGAKLMVIFGADGEVKSTCLATPWAGSVLSDVGGPFKGATMEKFLSYFSVGDPIMINAQVHASASQDVYPMALYEVARAEPDPTKAGWDVWDRWCHPKMLKDPGHFCLRPPRLADYPGAAEALAKNKSWRGDGEVPTRRDLQRFLKKELKFSLDWRNPPTIRTPDAEPADVYGAD